jgi:hypothetical protein
MSVLSRIAKNLFPDLVAPPILKGLPPSYAGIFKRFIRTTRVIHHPIYGEYSVVQLSCDEHLRLVEHNYDEKIRKHPGFKEIDPRDYGPLKVDQNTEPLEAQIDRIRVCAKKQTEQNKTDFSSNKTT